MSLRHVLYSQKAHEASNRQAEATERYYQHEEIRRKFRQDLAGNLKLLAVGCFVIYVMLTMLGWV